MNTLKIFILYIVYPLSYILFLQSCASYNQSTYIKSRFDDAAKKHLSGDYKGAIILYEQILQNTQNLTLKENVLLNLADAYTGIGYHEQSLEILNELIKNTKDYYILGASYFKLANFYFSVNQLNQTKKYLIEALKYPPKYYSLYNALQMAGKVCYLLSDTHNAKYYFLQ